MQITNNMRKQVYNILLTPICVTNTMKGIKRQGDTILSSQLYCRDLDPDMCDISMEFYKIIYGSFINNFELLDSNGNLLSKEFAGDTMNSYNTISKAIFKTNIELTNELQLMLANYKMQYHCLANFWVIPMRHGRTSKKMNLYDSLDLYMEYLRCNWHELKLDTSIFYGKKQYRKKYKNYFTYDYFESFENFCKKQFISNWDKDIKIKYSEKKYIEIISIITSFIYERARLITENDDICCRLYELFERYELLY